MVPFAESADVLVSAHMVGAITISTDRDIARSIARLLKWLVADSKGRPGTILREMCGGFAVRTGPAVGSLTKGSHRNGLK